MGSPSAEERSRLAFVAPWSMLSIIAFGYIAAQLGIYTALLAVFVILAVATFFFPRNRVTSNPVYKIVFVVAMMSCFIAIAVLPEVISKDYEKAIWLSSYAISIGIIEMAGLLLERRKGN